VRIKLFYSILIYCLPYPFSLYQAHISYFVILFNASAIAASNNSFVLAFTFRKYAFSFDHIISIGFKSGLYLYCVPKGHKYEVRGMEANTCTAYEVRVNNCCTGSDDRLNNPFYLVRTQIVHDNNIAHFQSWCKALGYIFPKKFAIE